MGKRVLALLTASAAVAIALAVAPPAVHAAAPAAVAGFPEPSDAETQLLGMLNQERTTRGMSALVRSPKLDPFAAQWAQYMADGNCLSRGTSRLCHRLDLLTVANTAFPYAWTKAAENVGLVPMYGTLDSLHNAFMNSPGHRLNILDPVTNAIGVGVRISADGTLFVAFEFIAVKGDPANPPPDPAAQLPAPSQGMSDADTFLLWINDARADAGLPPVSRDPVLDREAQFFSGALAAGTACRATVVLCHRTDLSTVAKTTAGPRGVRWWSENVGLRYPANLSSQFLGFMNSAPHRANILRPDINLVGIGYSLAPGTNRAYTVFEFVTARNLSMLRGQSAVTCGWIPSTLNKGARGPYVRTLQCALASAGFWTGPIDGVYSKAVVDAVKAYQKQKGVKKPSTQANLKTRRWLGVA